MPTPLIPQEIYLLEHYSSKEYFASMRDAWEEMVNYVEASLDRFMSKLPPDYRSRPQAYQPDIVWGELVLRNFRETRSDLYDSYIRLSHGDAVSLNTAHRVRNDVIGQREFSPDWFDELEIGSREIYYDLLYQADRYADQIWRTAGAYWLTGALSYRYDADARGPLPPLKEWPKYRLNPEVSMSTDDPVPRTGIYLPQIDDSCAQFLIAGEPADKANVGYDTERMQNVSREPTTWVLVERVPGEYVEDGLADLLGNQVPQLPHVPAGQPCPRTGWWYTPAKAHSRRYFQQSDVFPEIESSAYGATFWLWAQDQSTPAL